MIGMPTSRIKYVNRYINQHGKETIYYRPPGQRKTKLRAPLGSPEFWNDYLAASTGTETKPTTAGRITGSVEWLINRYKTSAHWRSEIGDKTRKNRGNQYKRFCREYGHLLVKNIKQKHLYQIQDAASDTPHETNNLMKALRPVFYYAVRNEIIDHNPLLGMSKLKGRNPDGYRAWADAEMEQFEAYWSLGTKQRLAYELIINTGQRRSDIVVLGKQHERDDWLIFTQFKGRNSKPQHMQIPIFDELRAVLDVSPTGDMTYLVTEYGKPFTANGFGNWFRDAIVPTGLTGVSAHGFRKAFAAKQAEASSTTKEIAALGGWDNLQQVELYTKAARRNKMAKNVLQRRKEGQN